MKIIVGLGNPGEKYEKTRHNAGFDVIDLLAETYGIETAQEKHRAKIGKGRIEGVPARASWAGKSSCWSNRRRL